MREALREEVLEAPVFPDMRALLDYMRAEIAHEPAEQLRVLFLDSTNRLIRDEPMALGSINETAVYPREIVRRALEINATALLLVHNHPSGDPSPSRGDIEATARVAEAARLLEIVVHDHIIVARSGWSSFRALGLM